MYNPLFCGFYKYEVKGVNDMEFSAVTTAITNMGSVVTTVLDTIAGNPLLMVLLACPVIVVGTYVFKKLVKAARG